MRKEPIITKASLLRYPSVQCERISIEEQAKRQGLINKLEPTQIKKYQQTCK